MHKICERPGNLKGAKHYVVIHTDKILNIYTLKSYIACYNICLYKRNIASENGIRYYGTPCMTLPITQSHKHKRSIKLDYIF